jgi:hypothetical protein
MTDMLLFRTAPDVAAGQKTFPWFRETWPPPQRLWFIVGKFTGMDGVFEPDEFPDDIAAIEKNFVVERYRLHSASEIDQAAPADARWFRGAEYLPEEGSP